MIKETHWFEMHAPGKQKFFPQYEEDIEKIEWVNGKKLKQKLTNTYPNVIEIIEKAKSSR